jgi:hypothetical protein
MDTTNTPQNKIDFAQIEIDKELGQMKDKYYSTKRKGTSCADVLQYMVDVYGEKKWHWAWELIGKTNSKGGYLSHRACARASDLAIKYPNLVEHKRIGRFKVYRVRKENREAVLKYLKENL